MKIETAVKSALFYFFKVASSIPLLQRNKGVFFCFFFFLKSIHATSLPDYGSEP